MAMKALMLRKKIDLKKKEQEALRAHGEELEKREAELTKAIDEVETEEEQGTVEEAVGEFEREKAEHEAHIYHRTYVDLLRLRNRSHR